MNLAEHNLPLSLTEILLRSLEEPPSPFEPTAVTQLRLRTIDLLIRADRAERQEFGVDYDAMFENMRRSGLIAPIPPSEGIAPEPAARCTQKDECSSAPSAPRSSA